MKTVTPVPFTSHHFIEADGVRVFYREAGLAEAPVVLLLHGFPTSSRFGEDSIPIFFRRAPSLFSATCQRLRSRCCPRDTSHSRPTWKRLSVRCVPFWQSTQNCP